MPRRCSPRTGWPRRRARCKAGGKAELRLHRDAEAVAALCGNGLAMPYDLIRMRWPPGDPACEPSLRYAPARAARTGLTLPALLRLDGNNLLMQAGDGTWQLAGWAYELIGRHVRAAWQDELAAPGQYRTSIAALRHAARERAARPGRDAGARAWRRRDGRANPAGLGEASLSTTRLRPRRLDGSWRRHPNWSAASSTTWIGSTCPGWCRPLDAPPQARLAPGGRAAHAGLTAPAAVRTATPYARAGTRPHTIEDLPSCPTAMPGPRRRPWAATRSERNALLRAARVSYDGHGHGDARRTLDLLDQARERQRKVMWARTALGPTATAPATGLGTVGGRP